MIQRLSPSSYHADILLVTVTELETIAVRRLFPNKLKHFIGDNTYYELGEVGGARVFLVRSEVGANGPGGAFATIDEGISLLSPSIVIMVGIAFGAAPQSQNIGDILVSEQIIEIEQVVSGPKGEPIIISRGDKALVSPRLIKRFKDGALEWREANEAARVRFGQICSGEKLIQSQDLRDQLQSLGLRVIGGEMEGVGLYAAAQANKVDWILVKAIADWADGKKDPDREKNQLLAVNNAARFAFYVIQQGGLIAQNKQGSRQKHEIQQEVQVATQPASVEARDILQRKTEANEFDVFLCYNDQDRAEVKKIGIALKERGILPWFDEWELVPGLPWQRTLERQIRTIKSAAVFIGKNGLGPWQSQEIDAFLREFVRRGSPVIPIRLPNAPEKPKLPVFLSSMSWVDFRRATPDPLAQLIWGITGERPGKDSIGGSEIAVSGVRDIFASSPESDIRADITEIRLAINAPSYHNYQQLAPAIIRRLGVTNFQALHSPDFERDTVWEILLPLLGLRLRTRKAIFFLRRGIETSEVYDRLIEIKNTREAEFLIVVDSIDIKQSPPPVTSDMVRLHPPLLEELIKAPSEEIVAWLGRLIASQVRNFERLIPFRTEGSVDLSIFFGRSYELDLLTEENARGGVIVGAHKSGKSSLLARIGERLRRDKYVVSGPYTIRSENINTFLLDTLQLEDFQQLHINIPATIDPEIWSTLLRDQRKKGKRLVLLLDEIDNLLKADAENDYKLGSEMRALQYDGLCKFYIAGHNQLREAITLEGKPFRNFAEEITLTGLDEEAAIRLIREPIGDIGFKVSERQAKQISEGTAGVAVLIQGFCRLLLLKIHSHGERNSDIQDVVIQKIERNPDYLNMVYEYFKYAQTATSQAITLIVSCLGEATRQNIIQGFGKYGVLLSWSKLEHSLRFLLKFGVLQELEDGHFCVLSKYLRKAVEIQLRDTDALLVELIEKSQREQ